MSDSAFHVILKFYDWDKHGKTFYGYLEEELSEQGMFEIFKDFEDGMKTLIFSGGIRASTTSGLFRITHTVRAFYQNLKEDLASEDWAAFCYASWDEENTLFFFHGPNQAQKESAYLEERLEDILGKAILLINRNDSLMNNHSVLLGFLMEAVSK